MAKKWQDLKDRTMSPERQEKVRQEALSLLEELPLQELRRARKLTQEQLAEVLEIAQSEVSRIEHRTDVYVSTLRRFIEAMGGELRIVADFGGNAVVINQFSEETRTR